MVIVEFRIDLFPLKSIKNSDMRFRIKEYDIHSRKSKETLTKNQYYSFVLNIDTGFKSSKHALIIGGVYENKLNIYILPGLCTIFE